MKDKKLTIIRKKSSFYKDFIFAVSFSSLILYCFFVAGLFFFFPNDAGRLIETNFSPYGLVYIIVISYVPSYIYAHLAKEEEIYEEEIIIKGGGGR